MIPQLRKLRKLVPVTTVSQPECVAKPTAFRWQCGKCEKIFAAHEVVRRGDTQAQVIGFCDHCHHLVLFDVVIQEGALTPTVTDGPIYIADRKHIDWVLGNFPHLQGVVD